MTLPDQTRSPGADTDRDRSLVTRLADALPDAADADLDRLHRRLAADAGAAGLLDVAYRTLDSPHGPLLLAATSEGLVRVAFEREGHDVVLASLAETVSPRILRATAGSAAAGLDAVAHQLDEYLAGERRTFDLRLDLRLVGGFRRSVVAHLSTIAYGSTASYADVAASAGNPKAVRAVGSACAHNPLPLVLPCHRVVRSDGSIGQYLGGVDTKAALLAMEAAG